MKKGQSEGAGDNDGEEDGMSGGEAQEAKVERGRIVLSWASRVRYEYLYRN